MNNFSETITKLEDEYWYGGLVEDGDQMPFKNSYACDMYGDLKLNQGSPLLISSKGRVVWSDSPLSFSITNEYINVTSSSSITLSQAEKSLKGAYSEATVKYIAPQKKSPDSLFFEQPQFCTWMEFNYEPTEEKILDYANAIIENGFKPGLFIIDDGWQLDFGEWQFDGVRFKDPKGMIEKLQKQGFKVMLWICPFVSPDSRAFRELNEKGLLIKEGNGRLAIREWWNGYSSLLDLSNEGAVSWIKGKMDELIETLGIDGFKMDAGDPQYYKSSDCAAKEFTPNDYSTAWAEIGLDYPLNEYRACWKLGGYPLVQRLSDKSHHWDALKKLIPNSLAQGLTGYVFNCPDMVGGGQYGDLLDPNFNWDQELFVRYAQCSALLPMMQFSTSPWRVLDKEHMAYCKDAVKVHEKFSDTIIKLAEEAAQTGEPIARHMFYEFNNTQFADVKDQFMLGSSILVAPVLNKGKFERKVTLPEGKWLSDQDEIIEGPCTLNVQAPLRRLPYFQLIK